MCIRDSVDAARLLLDKGAAVDRARDNGCTPLYAACFNGQVDGRTPLDIAKSQGHSSIVALLEEGWN